MAETPFFAADLPELSALQVEARDIRDFEEPNRAGSRVSKALWCLLATISAGSALVSAVFIFPGLIFLPMAFDAPGSESNPKVYISLLGMITLPCSLALSAFLACLGMHDVKLPSKWLLALPVVNLLMMSTWT